MIFARESYLRFRLEQVPDAFCAIDVDADETLKQAYGLRVPVLLHLDQVISEGKWEIERIEESLKQAGY